MMKPIINHIKQLCLLMAVVIMFSSCIDGLISRYDHKECDYSIQLRYDYNEENTNTRNLIEYYVFTIDEYIFDEQGILVATNHIVPDPCGDGMKSEQDLPPGRYTVIAIGNKGTESLVGDRANEDARPQEGQTRREDLYMTLRNANLLADATVDQNERLYYAYRTFSVVPDQVSRVRIDMVHQHFVLKFRVRWQNNPPANTESFYAVIEDVATDYTLMPEFVHLNSACEDYSSLQHDTHETACNDPRQFICTAKLCDNASVSWNYQQLARMNGGRQLTGEFVTYRHRNDTHAMLGIYRSVSGSRGASGGGTLIHKNKIDLSAYFTHPNVGIDLDRTLKQDYNLELLINDNGSVTISAIDVANWDEGGEIM